MRLGDLDRIKQDVQDNNAKNYDKQDWTSRQVATLLEGAPTIDPVRAAGGCYCRECCFGRKPRAEDMQDGYVYCQEQSKYKEIDSFCSDGELRGAQDESIRT